MKIFQQLLVAPAALGLLAPVAANAADLNIDTVSNYADSSEQVTSISQFSDVYPTDWAYQALSNLIERYGCVAGYPNGSFGGNRAMTRYEAAALLNACLDRISEVTDELRRLIKEFERELAIVGGRVDGLEARVGELEATQFSTTTKLRSKVDFVMGGTAYAFDKGYNGSDLRNPATGEYKGSDAMTFSYRWTNELQTSFTGKDLLYARLRSGNFGPNSPFNSNGYGGSGQQLSVAFNSKNTVTLNKLWYQFPVNKDFMVYVGPRVENYYMLSHRPTNYHQILKTFKLGGYGGVYGASTGSGAGLTWVGNRYGNPREAKLGLTANYVSKGHQGDPNEGGIMTDASKGKFLGQIAYGTRQWQLAAGYAYIQRGGPMGVGTEDGGRRIEDYPNTDANAFALSAFWSPEDAGWIPGITGRWELTSINLGDEAPDGLRNQTQSWMVGLTWDDVFLQGNKMGYAIGELQWVTEQKGGGTPNDGNISMEWWYQFQVTDNIAVTPAVFWLSRPFGQQTGDSFATGGKGADSFGVFGGLVKTTFRF